MKETWYYLDSNYCSPSFNMAMDEMLLQWHSKGDIPPVIRFYGWKPAGLSVGYFQKVNGKIDLEGLKQHGIEIVRRQTGGRAVLHDQELTYSIIVKEEHKQIPKSVKEAYLVLSKGILEGFRELNVQAEFAIPEGRIQTSDSAVCFEEPSWYELIVEGRKAAGSAQTRQKGVILQHGSIPINVDKVKLFDLFVYPNDRVKERARRAFDDKAVAINEVSEHPVTFADVKEAFKKGFERGLNINLQPFQLSDQQIHEVEQLAKNKYQSNEWNYYR